MTRIICRYDACIFWRDSLCTAKEIEYDPDQGCLTAQDRDEYVGLLDDEEEEWDEDEELEADEEAKLEEDEPDEEELEEDDDEFSLNGDVEEDEEYEEEDQS
ncbi:MAG: hypothetical protein HY259_10205 [Chloroflexi bacterium]|nr:hypothetical protein [Chloroflexota bacterium]MBI3733810.1 hypothetical protein [Chloroflexota bacterium]